MTNMKHTPGPWRLAQFSNYSRRLIHHQGQEMVAEVFVGRDDEFIANARLIAAAPEMLEALGCAVSAIQLLYHTSSKEHQEKLLHYGDIIGRAIAKARQGTGPQPKPKP